MMASSVSCLSDHLWPPQNGCHGQFDFTLLFEQSVLSLIPSAALSLAAAVRIFSLSSTARQVNGRAFQVTKLVSESHSPRSGSLILTSALPVRSHLVCGRSARFTRDLVFASPAINQGVGSSGCDFANKLNHLLLALLYRARQVFTSFVSPGDLLFLFLSLRCSSSANLMAEPLPKRNLWHFHCFVLY